MKLSSAALSVALSSVLVLTACSGTDDNENGAEEGTSATADTNEGGTNAADSTGDAAGETGAAGDDADETTEGDDAGETTGADDADDAEQTAGGDDAEQTADGADEEGADDDVITRPADGAGVISTDEAEEIVDDLLGHAADSLEADPEEALELNERAFAGSDLRAANQAVDLRDLGHEPSVSYEPEDANVLAISRDDDSPRGYIVAQTVPESGVPELHLIASQQRGAEWRIVWSAPMLPETEVNTFDSRSEGSPVLRSGRGDLRNAPGAAVDQLLEVMEYPQVDDPPRIKSNGFAPAIRQAIEEQTWAVDEQATLEQDYSLREGSLRPIEFADGSAMIFPVLERTSTFHVRDGMLLDPSAEFTHYTGVSSVENSAEVDSLIFVAMHVQNDEDTRHEVIAAREQIVGARGN